MVVVMRTLIVGQALERIADHAADHRSRLRYLVTGDPRHLAAEIRLDPMHREVHTMSEATR